MREESNRKKGVRLFAWALASTVAIRKNWLPSPPASPCIPGRFPVILMLIFGGN